jgi:hypothetical protein
MKPKRAAEFLGSFWLVLGGCGSAVLAALTMALGLCAQLALAGPLDRECTPGKRQRALPPSCKRASAQVREVFSATACRMSMHTALNGWW